MSGIAGIVNFDGRPVSRQDIAAMTGAMAHRGPDGIGHHIDGSVGFGFCKMATTDEALAQDQPIQSDDGRFTLVIDGWLENYDELLTDLRRRGDQLRTGDDAEIVLRCFERWGEAMLERLHGDFALAVWDSRERRLFCARDRTGNRPFNYLQIANRMVVASDVAAIYALPWVGLHLDEGTLAEFLTDSWISRTHTFWQEVRRLPAAHKMAAARGGVQIYKYWAPNANAKKLAYKSEAEYAEHHRSVLADVVRRASRTSLPLAMEVSGGLDSTSVFAVAQGLARRGMLPAPSTVPLTMVFPGDSAADESELSREISRFVGVAVQEVSPTLANLQWYRERARREREFPGFANGVMSWGLRKRAAESGAKVIHSGLGGDEWLGDFLQRRGYYREEMWSLRWSKLLEWAREDLAAFGLSTVIKWGLSRAILPTSAREPVRKALSMLRGGGQLPSGTAMLLAPRLRNALEKRRGAEISEPTTWRSVRAAVLGDALTAWGVESEERMCSSLGLCLRHPLRSTTMIDYSLQLPDRYLVRGRTMKYLHRRSLSGMLPSNVLELGNKASFGGFVSRHIDETLAAVPGYAKNDWFAPGALERLRNEADSGLAASGVGSGVRLWVLGGFLGCLALLS